MARIRQHYCVFETQAGFCGLAWNAAGVTRFQLPAASAEVTEQLLLRRLSGAIHADPTPEIARLIASVKRYFAGEQIDFQHVALDLGDQTPDFLSVYTAARKLGWGETTTYGALAISLGFGPEFARDVGSAMARNPVALIIPCHRVLAAGQKIGGFSAPGGIATKQRMLEMEGVAPPKPGPVQQSLDV